jgi:hypothetical protein
MVSAIVYAFTIVLELWLNIVFLPLLVLFTSPIWIPTMIVAQISISFWMAIFTYTPVIQYIFLVIRWILYELPYWPRKFIWKIFYSIKSLYVFFLY